MGISLSGPTAPPCDVLVTQAISRVLIVGREIETKNPKKNAQKRIAMLAMRSGEDILRSRVEKRSSILYFLSIYVQEKWHCKVL